MLLNPALVLTIAAVLAPDQDKTPTVEPPTFPRRPAAAHVVSSPERIGDLIDQFWSEDRARAEQAAAALFWYGEEARERVQPWTRARHAQASRLAQLVIAWLDARAALEPAKFTRWQEASCSMLSDTVDKSAFGGFYAGRNLSRPLDEARAAKLDAPLLEIDEGALVVWKDRYPGLVVRLINGGEGPLVLAAQDSRVSILAEALDDNGRWRPIEALSPSTCGNSYHRVSLAAGRYVEFAAPRLEGPFKTQVRWRLSDELVTASVTLSIHPDQFVTPAAPRIPLPLKRDDRRP